VRAGYIFGIPADFKMASKFMMAVIVVVLGVAYFCPAYAGVGYVARIGEGIGVHRVL
jgi:hypothetical protein